MRFFREIGLILRSIMSAPPQPPARPSKGLSEALRNLDCATEEIKKDAGEQTNSQVLMQMLEKLK